MLNQLKQGGRSEPFFYLAGKEPILNRTADHTLVSSAVEQLDRLKLGKSGNLTISLNEQQYIVNYIRSESLAGISWIWSRWKVSILRLRSAGIYFILRSVC